MLFRMLYELHLVIKKSQLWDGLHIGAMNIYLHPVLMLGRRCWLISLAFPWSIMLVVAHVFSRLLDSVQWQRPAFKLVI
jgi:hypothetical protein